jgi:hypothetical protein
MFLYIRFIVARALAWCLGMSEVVAPWQAIALAREVNGELYWAVGQRVCQCSECKAKRGEINGHGLLGARGTLP